MKTKFSSAYLKQVFGWIEPNMVILFKNNTTGYVKSIVDMLNLSKMMLSQYIALTQI